MSMKAQAEKANSRNSRPVNDSSLVTFTWKIDYFSRLNVEKLYTDHFNAGGYSWRILIYPKGNNCKKDHLSMYLDAADSATLPNGWIRHAMFRFSVISQIPAFTVRKEAQHAFRVMDSHWGFTFFMPLSELNDPSRRFLVDDTFTVEVEVRLHKELGKKELKRKEKSKEISSSFAKFDTLFKGIHNLVEGKTSKVENLSSIRLAPFGVEEIADAKKLVKQCLDMDLASVIQLGQAPELKNSLAIILASDAFADNMVDGATKFLAEFERSCERYESVNEDLSEAREDEKAVSERRTILKQLFSEFTPVRNQAEAVDREIARLEKQMAERRAKKARLSTRLEDLASRATSSKKALVNAEQKMKLSAVKKELAEKTVGNIEKSWESFKVGCSQWL